MFSSRTGSIGVGYFKRFVLIDDSFADLQSCAKNIVKIVQFRKKL